MTNREAPNSNIHLPPEDWKLLTPDAKELSRKLPNDMRSILLQGRYSNPISNINSGNRFNKTKSNKYKTSRPLSCKGKTSIRANLHDFLSDLLVDDDAYEDAGTWI